MIIHCVFFWLKDGISGDERATFLEGARSLLAIPGVAGGYVGEPAATEPRPIIDRSYDHSLVLMFDDIAAHDVYQEHPIHDAFRELAPLWQRVQIYDTASL